MPICIRSMSILYTIAVRRFAILSIVHLLDRYHAAAAVHDVVGQFMKFPHMYTTNIYTPQLLQLQIQPYVRTVLIQTCIHCNLAHK